MSCSSALASQPDPVTRAAAADLLRRALEMHPDYSFFIRAEKLARKCRDHAAVRRHTRIALVGSSTTTFLASALELLCLRDGIRPEIYEAPFGTFRQTILDDRSRLYEFQPDFIVLLLNWRDTSLPDVSPAPADAAGEIADEYERLWEHLATRTRARVIQTTFAMPPTDPYHALSTILDGGRASVLREINRRLLDRAHDRVAWIDTGKLAASHAGVWDDPVQWSSAKAYPAAAALPEMAEQILSYLRAHLGLTRKVLALDLDNTLWGGVIGEDGPGRIKLGPPSAIGERYQTLQRYLLSLKQRGILLAVVSKNNYDDAAAVFRHHTGSALALDDFVAFKANWNDKTDNLRHIASSLNLGLDSFVFLDDNPAERARVRSVLPDVAVPEISGEPASSIAALERGLYFQALRLTEEDRRRAASYCARTRSQNQMSAYTSVAEYLDSLDMEIRHEPVNSENCARVAQLINKTNQFNLTTKRYGEEQVRLLMDSGRWWFHAFRLRDRFADHGLIAVLLAEKSDEVWRIDTWLLSCRVIGRGVEKFMFNTLLEAARSEQAKAITAVYIPTAKNAPVSSLLPDLGFGSEAQGAYRLDPLTAPYAECAYFRPAGERIAAD